MGDKTLSDEVGQIAAGMLFAGYKGVIGTIWLISDRVAPHMAKDVYEQLFGTDTMPDCREAVRAMHNAVGRLREKATRRSSSGFRLSMWVFEFGCLLFYFGIYLTSWTCRVSRAPRPLDLP